ncbi:MAG: sugar transferase, partial [Planctomycetaceae bacterium]|nr:sugar transferase [Planctomycetaceae bacterium]
MNSLSAPVVETASRKTSSQLASADVVAADSQKTRPATDLSDLVSGYAEVLPRTKWLTQLHLLEPRENLKCLPLATQFSKRLTDIVGAIVLIILCSPLMLLTALLVKLTSPGPVIYKQTRVGLNLRSKKKSDRRQRQDESIPENADRRQATGDRREQSNYGALFTIYKFRTMRTDAERGGAKFATKGDARITPIGRFLRRSRIDELPQLWNILKGEMSLVGPRPERPEFMEQLQQEIPNYVARLGLKPGLSGIAQILNGYDNEVEGFRKKVAYDLVYLQNCCFRNDMKI